MTEDEFVAAYREYLPAISRFMARRVDLSQVEDLASDVFEIAWHKRNQPSEGFELAWLYKIAGYVLANHRRKQVSQAKALLSLRFVDYSPNVDLIAITDVDLGRALAELAEKDRALIALTALDGLAVKDAAALLGISANAASIRLNRARARLSSMLEISD